MGQPRDRPLDPTELRAVDLRARLDRGETVVALDVREAVERDFAAIPWPEGVRDLHVPLSEIQGRLEEVRLHFDGPPVVVYCHHGVRSRMVVEGLRRIGLIGALNLAGGIDAWAREVDPTVPRY